MEELLTDAAFQPYISSNVLSLGASNAKPNLGVYYESLCPYSRQFIREEIWPAYQVLAEYFDVEFVAYGNARVSRGRNQEKNKLVSVQTTGSMESGFSIECQHGEQECVGNVVQACTVKYVPDMWSQVGYNYVVFCGLDLLWIFQVYLLNCMSAASSPQTAGAVCFEELGLDYDPVQVESEYIFS